MAETILHIDNVSKLYRLGQIGTGTLSHDLNRWWAKVRGKEDPFLKIGEVNRQDVYGESKYVWALRDINLEVKQGEVLGIIGKNGAGKSTLLKILARVTGPTTGQIKVKGRIGSLLEVGTGFHPELTGRENVFLNGAILGMTRAEVRDKFDAIVDFAGIERYIDTPVKRYSSGMYVRLAFAVAAFLEPEILIVDEVLAVGDIEFQKRAIGKMQDVSRNDGRTVLFVSHNMGAVGDLCSSAVSLSQGAVIEKGPVRQVISTYLANTKGIGFNRRWENMNDAPGCELIKIRALCNLNEERKITPLSLITERVGIKIEYDTLKDVPYFVLGVNFFNSDGNHIFSSHDTNEYTPEKIIPRGKHGAIVWIPGNLLQAGDYFVGVAGIRYNPFTVLFHETEILEVKIIDTKKQSSHPKDCNLYIPGLIKPKLVWEKIE